MKETVAFQMMVLYRDFLAYTTGELKKLGLSFGLMPLVLYIGKHPRCSQADLTRMLRLDWGYSQRSIKKLVEVGLIRKEYDDGHACNCLTLTEAGEKVFDASHNVFASWDQLHTTGLSPEERDTLLRLLTRLTNDLKES